MAMWTYRPTDEEHELILRTVKRDGYDSVAQFIREGALRLAHKEGPPILSLIKDAEGHARYLHYSIKKIMDSIKEDEDEQKTGS